MKSLLVFIVVLTTFLSLHSPAYAVDKQGKRSLETYRSRPKENPPAKSGSQRVRENTKDRVNRILRK